MPGVGGIVYQVGTGVRTCERSGWIATVGKIEPGVTTFDLVTLGSVETFVVFGMRFTGLPSDMGARPSYNYDHRGYSLAACPGSVMVSLATSCESVALSPESTFTALEPVDGMNAAYFIATEPGWYAASWAGGSRLATTTVELGSGISVFAR